jgi:hypothetical protein
MVFDMTGIDIADNTILFYMAIINFVLIIILLVANIINKAKIKKLYNKYNNYMVSADGINIENLLEKCLLKIDEVASKNREIENHLNEIDRNFLNCIQKVAMIRYNAFDNVGSDLSYSVALLDGNDSGIVITSLFSRDCSTTYGKPILAGKSKYPLSAEEIKVINHAIRRYRESLYV